MSKSETREFKRSDIPGLMELIRRNGFPNRSIEGWTWSLFDNPEQGDAAPGLISLKDGAICAFVGIQIRLYSGKAGTKKIAMGHTLMSNDAGRGRGLVLARNVINYPDVDAMQTTSSNPILAPLLTRMGVSAAHGEAGRQYVDWIVRPDLHLIGRVMNYLARSDAMYRAFSRFEIFGRKPKSGNNPLQASDVKRLDFDCAEDRALFEQFSQNLSAAYPDAYLPVRTCETYAWRMADPDLPGRSDVLCYVKDSQIVALLTTTLTKPNAHEPWVNYVTDFVYLRDRADDGVLSSLINEGRRQTRLRGASLMRFKPSLHLPKTLLKLCGRHMLKAEPHDYCFVNFAKTETDLQASFVSSPYESDLIIALRVPAPKAN